MSCFEQYSNIECTCGGHSFQNKEKVLFKNSGLSQN